jgi:hypothetical protein
LAVVAVQGVTALGLALLVAMAVGRGQITRLAHRTGRVEECSTRLASRISRVEEAKAEEAESAATAKAAKKAAEEAKAEEKTLRGARGGGRVITQDA